MRNYTVQVELRFKPEDKPSFRITRVKGYDYDDEKAIIETALYNVHHEYDGTREVTNGTILCMNAVKRHWGPHNPMDYVRCGTEGVGGKIYYCSSCITKLHNEGM